MASQERMPIASKISILKKIRESKDILFGKFSASLTKEDKVKEWNKIFNHAISIGVAAKDFNYLRDTFWPNARRTTVNKRDNAKKTGSGGGIQAKFNEADHIIFDIIGRDSPVLLSLGVPDSNPNQPAPSINTQEQFREVVARACAAQIAASPDSAQRDGSGTGSSGDLSSDGSSPANPAESANSRTDPSATSSGSTSSSNTFTPSRSIIGPRRNRTSKKSIAACKKKKLDLQIRNLELSAYHLQLEILEKEKRLSLAQSPFTKDLVHFEGGQAVERDILTDDEIDDDYLSQFR